MCIQYYYYIIISFYKDSSCYIVIMSSSIWLTSSTEGVCIHDIIFGQKDNVFLYIPPCASIKIYII